MLRNRKLLFCAAIFLSVFGVAGKVEAVVRLGNYPYFQINVLDRNSNLIGGAAAASVYYSCDNVEPLRIDDNAQGDLDETVGIVLFATQASSGCASGKTANITVTNLGAKGYLNKQSTVVVPANASSKIVDSTHDATLVATLQTEAGELVKTIIGSVTYAAGQASYACVQRSSARELWDCPVPIAAASGALSINKPGFVLATPAAGHAVSQTAANPTQYTATLLYQIVISGVINERGVALTVSSPEVSGYIDGVAALDVDGDGVSGARVVNGKIYLANSITADGVYDAYATVRGYVPVGQPVIVSRLAQNIISLSGMKYAIVVAGMQNSSGADIMPTTGAPFSATGASIARQDFANGLWYVALKAGATMLQARASGYATSTVDFTSDPHEQFPATTQRRVGFQTVDNNFWYQGSALQPNTVVLVTGVGSVAVQGAVVDVYRDVAYTQRAETPTGSFASGTSDANGEVHIALPDHVTTYYLKASKAGYETYGAPTAPRQFSITPGQVNPVVANVTAQETGGTASAAQSSYRYTDNYALSDGVDSLALEITVRNASRHVLPNKMVALSNPANSDEITYIFLPASTTTNANGIANFQIKGFNNGAHTGTIATLGASVQLHVNGGTFTVEATPPSRVAHFAVSNSAVGTILDLSWQNPPEPDFDQLSIYRDTVVGGARRKAETHGAGAIVDSAVPFGEQDGLNTGLKAHSISVAPGAITSFRDTGLSAGTTYYYSIVTRDRNGNYQTANLEEKNGTPPVVGDAGAQQGNGSGAQNNGGNQQQAQSGGNNSGSSASGPGAPPPPVLTVSQVSGAHSAVQVSPIVVAVGGTEASTVTVELKATADTRIPGRTVTLTSGRPEDVVRPSSAMTGADGTATFTVASTTAGVAVLTARVDGVALPNRAAAVFVPPSIVTRFERFTPGQLVKLSCPSGNRDVNHPCRAVYFLGRDGYRHPFPIDRIFFSWYQDFARANILQVSDADMSAIPLGRPMPMRTGTTLVQITGESNVYYVEPGNILRKIAHEAQAIELFGSAWARRVHDLPVSFFSGVYAFGTTLENGEIPVGLILKSPEGTHYRITGERRREVVTTDALAANGIRSEFVVTMPSSVLNRIEHTLTTLSTSRSDIRFAY